MVTINIHVDQYIEHEGVKWREHAKELFHVDKNVLLELAALDG